MFRAKRLLLALFALTPLVGLSVPVWGQASNTCLVPPPTELVGEILAIRKAPIGTKVAGRLASVPLFVGDVATAGQIMAMLETQDLELSLQQTEANLEVTKARLKILSTLR